MKKHNTCVDYELRRKGRLKGKKGGDIWEVKRDNSAQIDKQEVTI
jgi:hypothetical protein